MIIGDWNYWLDKLRITIQSVVLFVISFLTPMSSALEVLFVVAVFDFVAGLAGNVWTNEERFRIGKAFGSLYKMLAYFLIVIVAHYAVSRLGQADEAWLLVKYITLLVIYWYFVNILSNLKKAFPRSAGITFLYLLLSLKILPLILQKMGLGGDDVQELADKAKNSVERKTECKLNECSKEVDGEKDR